MDSTKIYRRPTRDDYEDFLIRVVYRSCSDFLSASVDSAYRDFCRTMHGFSQVPNKQAIRQNATKTIVEQFHDLHTTGIQTQDQFDEWHRATNQRIIGVFAQASFNMFAGQAQKWINMTFKNIYVCGEDRVPGYERFYSFCHMPIDNIVLDQLEDEGIERPSKSWSRWDYGEYLDYQKTIREWCAYQPLLNIEHKLWIDGR